MNALAVRLGSLFPDKALLFIPGSLETDFRMDWLKITAFESSGWPPPLASVVLCVWTAGTREGRCGLADWGLLYDFLTIIDISFGRVSPVEGLGVLVRLSLLLGL